MSDFVKNIASLFPPVINVSKHFLNKGIDSFFPFYHAISDRPLPHIKHLYKVRTIQEFESDLDYLLKHFTPLKMSEYLSGDFRLEEGRPPMILSFDDGLIQCYQKISPILLKKGIPATFFLNNAFIDNRTMFFRFKVSLLVEQYSQTSDKQRAKAAHLLHCNPSEILKRLLIVSYVEREITDQIAEVWDFSFSDYLRKEPIYLSSMHIRKMQDDGFEFGSHGIDHPLFSLLKKHVAIDHIMASVEDLKKRYSLDYKYFAFPFTDTGVQDDMIIELLERKIIDAGFGTAGLKDELIPSYFQRVPMEFMGKDAKSILNGEINRRNVRKILGRNKTVR